MWPRRAAFVAAIAVTFVIMSNLLVNDRMPGFHWLSYIPAMLLLPLGLLACLLACGKWIPRLGLAGLIIVTGVPVLLREQPLLLRGPMAAEDHPAGDANTLLVYNVMAYHWDEDGVLEVIRRTAPDILVLVEGTFSGRRPPNVAEVLGDEYHWAVGRILSVASRFPVVESREVSSSRHIHIMRVVIEVDGREIAVYNVDVMPPMRRTDRKAFDELWAVLRMEDLPLIVAGDLNAPRGSWQLRRVMDGYTDATVAASAHRYLATWRTIPFPLWQIDHVFVSPEIRPVRASILSSRASDHHPVMLEFILEE